MSLPEFNAEGDLPAGVHQATLVEALFHFGGGSPQRHRIAARLARIHELAVATEQLARFVIFGSFVTNKAEPRDIDVIMVMDDEFDVSILAGEAALLFQHDVADAHFGASVFWVRRLGAIGGEQAMIEYWQTRREGGLRGIVEIIEEHES